MLGFISWCLYNVPITRDFTLGFRSANLVVLYFWPVEWPKISEGSSLPGSSLTPFLGDPLLEDRPIFFKPDCVHVGILPREITSFQFESIGFIFVFKLVTGETLTIHSERRNPANTFSVALRDATSWVLRIMLYKFTCFKNVSIANQSL